MKKIMMFLIAALLMLGVSGQAMAAFNEGDLIRVVYTGTGSGSEYATDLGKFSNLTSPSSLTAPVHNTTDTFSLSSVGATSWSNVNVAYFIMTSGLVSGADQAWTSGSAATGGYTNVNQNPAFQGAAFQSLSGWQAAAGTANSVKIVQSDPSSYWQNMNGAVSGAATPGFMGGLLDLSSGHTGAEQNLGALATTGYVDQTLFYYANPDSGARGTAVAMLRTSADGSTTLSSVNPVPIPAAMYLFGSGLLGLVGLRRKIAA